MNLSENQKAYLSGIIDSDGSIELVRSRRGKAVRRNGIRIRVSTKDDVIVPTIATWLERNVSTYKNGIRTVEVLGEQAYSLALDLLPYLFLKQPRAES